MKEGRGLIQVSVNLRTKLTMIATVGFMLDTVVREKKNEFITQKRYAQHRLPEYQDW